MASDRMTLDVGAGALIALALAGVIFFIFAFAMHSQNKGDSDDAVFKYVVGGIGLLIAVALIVSRFLNWP